MLLDIHGIGTIIRGMNNKENNMSHNADDLFNLINTLTANTLENSNADRALERAYNLLTDNNIFGARENIKRAVRVGAGLAWHKGW